MKKRMFLAVILMLLMFGSAVPVYAKMSGGSFVSTEAGAVDSITVNGVTVDALFPASGGGYDRDSTYSCAALVHRFYSEVYGRTVSNLENIASVPMIDQGSFMETSTPKVGDILRDNESVHWAIVKEVNGNTVTLIQQNAWDGTYTKAWVGAQVEIGDSRYTFFTWDGNTGSAALEPEFSIQYHDLEVYDTNAVPHAYVMNPQGLTVQQVGCYVWNEDGELLCKFDENCCRTESQFNMWYDFNSELGIALEPGTGYIYQFYVMYNGVEYQGEQQGFVTTGENPYAAAGAAVAGGLQQMADIFDKRGAGRKF